MSRVRVLGLPKTVTNEELKRFVQSSFARDSVAPTICITDCNIFRNEQGAVRMAFLGFKTVAAAQYVVKHLNDSYFGSRKISVQVSKSVLEARMELQQQQQQHEGGALISNPRGISSSAKVAPSRVGLKRGRGEDVEMAPAAIGTRQSTAKGPPARAGTDREDAKREQFVRELMGNKPGWASEVLVPPSDASGAKAAGDGGHETLPSEEEALRKQQSLANVADADFLQSKLSSVQPSAQQKQQKKKHQSIGSDLLNDANAKAKETAVVTVPENDQGHSGGNKGTADDDAPFYRIRVVNIPFSATEDEIKNYFSTQVGPVSEVHIPRTRDTKRSKGFAFVVFSSDRHAKKAVTQTGSTLMGRIISIQRAVDATPKPESSAKEKAPSGSTGKKDDGPTAADATPNHSGDHRFAFKRERDEKHKATAPGASHQWNPLYMDSAAAIANIAKRLNVTAHDIVSANTSGAAVRAAVAETVLTTEARQILSEEGIDFSVIERGKTSTAARSDVTILVKNIPATGNMQELTRLFARYGTIETIAVPKDPTFLVLRFVKAQDAKIAFRRIAFRKFCGAPLLLEWAPIGCLRDIDHDESDEMIGKGDGAPQDEPSHVQQMTSVCTAYVTNIPFGIQRESFESTMLEAAPRLASRPELLKRIDLQVEKGRAFVTVSDEPTLRYLVTKLNGKVADGRVLSVVPSRGRDAAANSAVEHDNSAQQNPHQQQGHVPIPADANPCKLVVKNLPFEATEADLRELFSNFHEVKAVRVPKKLHRFTAHRTNNHRGFGFVEFYTEKEAAKALVTLSSTHLYGRHLVLAYATKSSTMDA